MAQLAIQQTLEQAMRHHQAGRLRDAEPLYRKILAIQPAHIDAVHLLGVLAHQTGRNDIAIDLIRRAIALRPNFPEANSNLGIALAADKQFDEAIAAYRSTIALVPDFPGVHLNLGIALAAKGELDEAIAVYREAIRVKPDYAEAYINLGNALKEKGLQEEAIAALRQGIAFNPKLPQAYNNLGNALSDAGDFDEAIAAYHKAIALRSNYGEVYSNLGSALEGKGQLDEAINAYRQAIVLNPKLAEAYNNLGNTLKTKGRLNEAIASSRQAIALRPEYAKAHYNLGNALKDKGELDEAIVECRQAISLRPDYAQAHCNLGNILKEKGELDAAIAAYRQSLLIDPNDADIDSNFVFGLHYHPGYDGETIAEEHRRWNRQHAESLKPLVLPHVSGRSSGSGSDRQLKVGYVSSDFRNHPVGRFMLPLVEHHDRGQFEIFCYSNNYMDGRAIGARFRACVDQWRKIAGVKDERVAEQIRADGIDILVDLSGHTAQNRLLVFARKPAPVQVSYLGYPNMTGLKTIDFRLTDGLADPVGLTDRFYAEKLYRLPRSNWCFVEVEANPVVEALPAIRRGYVTFGSFNNCAKVTEPMLQVWGRIMGEVAGSRLLLKSPPFASASVQDRVRGIFAAQGIDGSRLIFHGMEPKHSKHMAMYGEMDIALDTFPYHGTTTTCDALWMGVPVVTLAGETHVSRVGLSLLTNIGLPELVAVTEDQYVQIAVDLARDRGRMAELRRGMRDRMRSSPLMDAKQFARDVEAAYRQMASGT